MTDTVVPETPPDWVDNEEIPRRFMVHGVPPFIGDDGAGGPTPPDWFFDGSETEAPSKGFNGSKTEAPSKALDGSRNEAPSKGIDGSEHEDSSEGFYGSELYRRPHYSTDLKLYLRMWCLTNLKLSLCRRGLTGRSHILLIGGEVNHLPLVWMTSIHEGNHWLWYCI